MKIHRLNFLRGPAARFRRLAKSRKIASAFVVTGAMALVVCGGVGAILNDVSARSNDLVYVAGDTNGLVIKDAREDTSIAISAVVIGGTQLASRCVSQGAYELNLTIPANCLSSFAVNQDYMVILRGTEADGSDWENWFVLYIIKLPTHTLKFNANGGSGAPGNMCPARRLWTTLKDAQ